MLHSAESIFRQFAAEFLREFETEFENILGVNQGPGPGQLIYEKNQKSKISRDCLFKAIISDATAKLFVGKSPWILCLRRCHIMSLKNAVVIRIT
jgi:hypothetical protein